MTPRVISAFLALAGGCILIRNIGFLRDEAKLQRYLETSPKARLWIGMLGPERTFALTKRLFIPLGILLSAALLIVGLIGAFAA